MFCVDFMETSIEEIRILISKSEFAEAFKKAKELVSHFGKGSIVSLIALESRFSTYNRQLNSGLNPPSSELNLITKAFLEHLNEFEERQKTNNLSSLEVNPSFAIIAHLIKSRIKKLWPEIGNLLFQEVKERYQFSAGFELLNVSISAMPNLNCIEIMIDFIPVQPEELTYFFGEDLRFNQNLISLLEYALTAFLNMKLGWLNYEFQNELKDLFNVKTRGIGAIAPLSLTIIEVSEYRETNEVLCYMGLYVVNLP